MAKSIQKKSTKSSSAVKASFWFTVCNIFQKGVQVLVVPIYTRVMSVEQYGQYAVYLSWHDVISIFVTLNMWNYLINNVMAKYPETKDKVFSAIQGLSTTVTLCFCGIYLLFSNIWQKTTGLSPIVMGILFIELLVYPSYGYYIGKKRYEYEYKPIVALTVIQTILVPLISVPLILSIEEKGIAAIAGRSLTLAVIYMWPAIIIWKRGKVFFNKEYWKYALRYNVPLIPHFLSMVVLQQSDRIMIEQICGEEQAGIYALAYQAASVVQVFSSAVVVSYVPYTYQKIQKKDFENIAKYGYMLLGVLICMNLALILVAPEAIMILGTEDYWKAIYIIPPVAISTVFIFMFNMFANFEYYFEETKFVPMASAGAGISNIILNAIFIPRYGMYAAGYTTLICYILFSVGHYGFMKLVCKKHLSGVKIFRSRLLILIGGIAVVLSLLITLFYEYWYIRYGLLCVGTIIAFYNRKELYALIRLSKKN